MFTIIINIALVFKLPSEESEVVGVCCRLGADISAQCERYTAMYMHHMHSLCLQCQPWLLTIAKVLYVVKRPFTFEGT